MATGTYVPGSAGTVNADKLIQERWAREIDILACELPVLSGKIKDLGPTGREIHVPLIGSFSRTIISETLAGTTGLTFVGNAETEVTFTPRTSVIPLEVTKSVGWRALAYDINNALRMAADKWLLLAIDSDVLSLATAFVTNVVGDAALDLAKGDYLDAYQLVTGGALEFAQPGKDEVLVVVYQKQIDDLLNIADFTSALFRGDSQNPAVAGWVRTAFGMSFSKSNSVDVSGGYAANMALVPRALGIGFNAPKGGPNTMVITESFQIWDRIILLADYAYGEIRDAYGCLMKSKTT